MRIILRDLSYRYNGEAGVTNLNLQVESGELFGLLGPSGCGKTTTLRLLAGFIQPEHGHVFFGDEDITGKRPEQRNVGMVFQSYALFPHMTVHENVEFGLLARGVPKKERGRRVRNALELVQLAPMERRSVADLSGGQQQRVAVARALVIEPTVLLLDEPLSNLDARLREETGQELRALQRRLGITTVYVTHDRAEAFALCDRIGIMQHGRLIQVGAPQDLFASPGSLAVAQFIGHTNIIPVEHIQKAGGGWTAQTGPHTLFGTRTLPQEPTAALAVRPHEMTLDTTPISSKNTLLMRVSGRRFLGADMEISVQDGNLRLKILQRFSQSRVPEEDSQVYVHIPPEALIPLAR